MWEMAENQKTPVLRRRAFAAAVVLLFLYFQMWQLNFYLARSIKSGIYLFFPPLLIAGVLYYRRLRDGIEVKLVAAYLLWVVLTRVFNGDRVLSREYLFVLDLALMLPFFSLGLVLDAGERRGLLNLLSVILGVYFFALGSLCVSCYLRQSDLFNPITGGRLCGVARLFTPGVITLLDVNPNVSSYWFYIGGMLMLYQFFACNSLPLRALSALALLMDFCAIVLGQCRSILLCASVSAGLLCGLLLLAAVPKRGGKHAAKALVLLAGFAGGTLVCLLLFLLAGKAAAAFRPAERIAAAPTSAAEVAAAAEPAPLAARSNTDVPWIGEPSERFKTWDARSSGRLSLYAAALDALRDNPRTLLVGQSADEVMTETNYRLMITGYPTLVHFHNYLLQTLMLTGLPGLLLVLAVSLLLALRAFRMFLASGAPLREKLLWLPVLGTLLFGQMESGFFSYTDERTLCFYLVSGLALGEWYDWARAQGKTRLLKPR